MLEVEKKGQVVFNGNKDETIIFLKNNGLTYNGNNIPLLILGCLASNIGFDLFIR